MMTDCPQALCYQDRDAHGGHHGDPAMFQFDRPAALESSHITVRSEPNRVPEPDWRLHAKFVLEGKPSRSLLDSKVSERTASQTILQNIKLSLDNFVLLSHCKSKQRPQTLANVTRCSCVKLQR